MTKQLYLLTFTPFLHRPQNTRGLPLKACLMLVSFKCIRALPSRRIASRCLHTLRNEPPLRNKHVLSRPPRVPNRGAKKKSSAKLDELPQGTIPLEPLALEEQEPALPTVLLQARSNMRKFENCVLLTRVGGFYELYFEHADEFGPLLNLKVAPKSTGPRTNPVIVSMVWPPRLG